MFAIQAAWGTLRALAPAPTDGDFLQDLLNDDDGDESALSGLQPNVTTLSQRIDKLTDHTRQGLSRTEKLKAQSAELASAAQSLKCRIGDVQVRVNRAMDATETKLSRSITQYNHKVDEYNSVQLELMQVEGELEDQKDNRTLLRAVSHLVPRTLKTSG